MRRPLSFLLAVLVVLGSLLPGPAVGAQPTRQRTEADLKALESRIERIRQQVQRDAVERNRLNRDLRAAEQSVATARGELVELREARAVRAAERERLAAERAAREAHRDKTQQNLAEQLRAAYFMGQNEPLKLLLNQRNPAEFGRNLAYYGYFGRLRASQIEEINQNIASIDELAAKIEEEDARLRELEAAARRNSRRWRPPGASGAGCWPTSNAKPATAPRR